MRETCWSHKVIFKNSINKRMEDRPPYQKLRFNCIIRLILQQGQGRSRSRMVELAEGCIVKKKMLKIKGHHHQRHCHRHSGTVFPSLAGHLGGIEGAEIVVVLRGKHHHRHHGYSPCGEELGHGRHHGKKHHHTGHGHGQGPFGVRGLKHHGRRPHGGCRGLGLIFQHHQGGDEAFGAGASGTDHAAEAGPSVPQTEVMMNNLTLATDKDANQP